MTRHDAPRVLFISYNGLVEPLGRSQVVPYVIALASSYRMTVLSFEKPSAQGAADQRRLDAHLRDHGITWIRLRYHRRPSLPATAYDIFRGIACGLREHRRERIDLIHARGYVPAAVAWGLRRLLGIPYLFDIRGLQAEEYVDANHWSRRSIRFRVTKHMEQRLLREAGGLVTLSEAIRPVLRQFPGLKTRSTLPPWEVIPSCVDLDHFVFCAEARERIRRELDVGQRPLLVYAGSLGTWYMLDEMLEFYVAARRIWPEMLFLILPNASEAMIRPFLARHGLVEGKDVLLRRAGFEAMPHYLSAADAGVAFIRPCLSKRSSSPTKYAEYLACGLPLAVNVGVGDVERWVEREGAGVLVRAFTEEAYTQAARALRQQAQRGRNAFRMIAEDHFSISGRAVHAYRRLYEGVRAPSTRVDFQEDT